MSIYGSAFDRGLDRWITGNYGEDGWTDAPSGTAWVGEWYTREDEKYEDVEVELDEGQVISATCCGEKACDELLKDLEERYEDD